MMVLNWPITGVAVVALVVIGAGLVSAGPPSRRWARVSFTAAAVLLLAKAGWWLAFEMPAVSAASRVIVGLVVAGVTAAWWIGAMSWARRAA